MALMSHQAGTINSISYLGQAILHFARIEKAQQIDLFFDS